MRWLILLTFCVSIVFGLDLQAVDDLISSFWKPVFPAPQTLEQTFADDLHVIIVDTSRYYHNYRHVTNALVVYRIVKWLGVPDEQIYLFLGECSACDPRNAFPGQVYTEANHPSDLFHAAGPAEVDFRSWNVHSKVLKDLLTGRRSSYSAMSRQLHSTANSNVLIYINGHGGDLFTKFQDFDELSSTEIGEAIEEMRIKRRYRELSLIIDSCQALTVGKEVKSPNTLFIGSSKRGENAYSCNDDPVIGLSLMDRFSFLLGKFFETFRQSDENITVHKYLNQLDQAFLLSPPGFKDDMLGRSIKNVPLLDFFAHPRMHSAHKDSEAFVRPAFNLQN